MIHCDCCLNFMRRNVPDKHVDLAVTSPPYDGLRLYNGYDFPFEDIVRELYRIMRLGGVVVWVVGDATVNGSETGTSFKQALFFMDVGFKLHDTMIYRKLNPVPNAGKRYQQSFEYMFIFSKGTPTTHNIACRKRRNACNDKRTSRVKGFNRNVHGEVMHKMYAVREDVPKDNIWEYYVGGGNSTSDAIAFKHPAIFPEKLAEDHILSWSVPGDIVFDPFMGSGTTGKMAILHGRKFIGCDVSLEYCSLAFERIYNATGGHMDELLRSI